jgi:serine protease
MPFRRAAWLTAALVGVTALCAFAPANAGGPALTHRLVVRFVSPREGGPPGKPSAALVARLTRRAGMTLTARHAVSDDARVFALPEWVPETVAAALAARLAADPAVQYAMPDRLKTPLFVPTDPLYPQQWNLFGDAGGVRLPAAWDRERGAPAVVVAMLDSGVLAHEDLDPARFVPGYDFISDPQIANDGDGRDGECGGGEPAEPSSWHGTHVAGVIGAATDNGVGIAGVNHGSRLLMARVLGKCGGYTSDIVDALRWAAGLSVPGVPDNVTPARVVNLSLGGDGPCSPLEQNAVDEVNARGVAVVVAAGNGTGDVADRSPANCRGVITVAATTRSGGRTAYTNTGSAVAVSAPGGDAVGDAAANLIAPSNNGTAGRAEDDYALVAGTSFAAAQVSGIAGLMVSTNADLSPQQIRDILMQTARAFPDPSCDSTLCGTGIVDAAAAVQAASSIPGQPDADGDGVKDIYDLCPETPAGSAVDLDGCSAGQLDSGNDGGGGGGCVLSDTGVVDPLFPLLALAAGLGLMFGRRPGAGRAWTGSVTHAEVAQGGAEGIERADDGVTDNHRVTEPVIEGGCLSEFEYGIGYQRGGNHHCQHGEDDIGEKVRRADVSRFEELDGQHDHAESDEDVPGHAVHIEGR